MCPHAAAAAAAGLPLLPVLLGIEFYFYEVTEY